MGRLDAYSAPCPPAFPIAPSLRSPPTQARERENERFASFTLTAVFHAVDADNLRDHTQTAHDAGQMLAVIDF
jgi:hypothetical protein